MNERGKCRKVKVNELVGKKINAFILSLPQVVESPREGAHDGLNMFAVANSRQRFIEVVRSPLFLFRRFSSLPVVSLVLSTCRVFPFTVRTFRTKIVQFFVWFVVTVSFILHCVCFYPNGPLAQVFASLPPPSHFIFFIISLQDGPLSSTSDFRHFTCEVIQTTLPCIPRTCSATHPFRRSAPAHL